MIVLKVLSYIVDHVNERESGKSVSNAFASSFLHIHIGVGSNSILGGPNIIYTVIAAINKVSRVKY